MKKKEANAGMLVVPNGTTKQSLNRKITDPTLVLKLIAKCSWGNEWKAKIQKGFMRGVNYTSNASDKVNSQITINLLHFKPAQPEYESDNYSVY